MNKSQTMVVSLSAAWMGCAPSALDASRWANRSAAPRESAFLGDENVSSGTPPLSISQTPFCSTGMTLNGRCIRRSTAQLQMVDAAASSREPFVTYGYCNGPGSLLNGQCIDPETNAVVAFTDAEIQTYQGYTRNQWNWVHPRQPVLISVSSGGLPANPNNSGALPYNPELMGSAGAAISDDGRYVFFHSAALGLVPEQTEGFSHIYVHDLANGTTELISTTSGGALLHGQSQDPNPSGDGRFVCFLFTAQSTADGLGLTLGSPNVLVKDRWIGTLQALTKNGGAVSCRMDDSGAATVFVSRSCEYCDAAEAQRVRAGGTPQAHVFVSSIGFGGTVQVDSSPPSGVAEGDADYADISGDGRYVAFDSTARNLSVDGNPFGVTQIFGRDLSSLGNPIVQVSQRVGGGALRPSLVNLGVCSELADRTRACFWQDGAGQYRPLDCRPGAGNDGEPCIAAFGSVEPTLSRDASRIDFTTYSPDVVPAENAVRGNSTVAVADLSRLLPSAITNANPGAGGAPALGTSADQHLSRDGRWAVFESNVTNLAVSGASGLMEPGTMMSFAFDARDGQVTLLSATASGAYPTPQPRCAVALGTDVPAQGLQCQRGTIHGIYNGKPRVASSGVAAWQGDMAGLAAGDDDGMFNVYARWLGP